MDELFQTYSDLWNLSNVSLIAETNTSHVYKVKKEKQECVLKIYTPTGKEAEALGPIFLNFCKESNAVVDVIHYDDNAALLDYINGEELLTLVDAGKDDDASQIIGQTLNRIHAMPVPKDHPFETFETHFEALLNHANDAPALVHSGANLLRVRLSNQQDIRLLHGDIHHTNIMHHNTKGWITLDPHPVIGDRAYDCANTLHNPLKRPQLTENKDRILQQIKTLSNETNIDPQRIIDYGFIHGCIASCWTKEHKGHYEEKWLNTSKILEPFISKE